MRTILTMLPVLLIVFLAFPAQAQHGRSETIAVVVNEEALSRSDVEERLKLVIKSAGLPDNQEVRARIMPQIINVLIDEKLKLQEAARLEIEITGQDIQEGFEAVSAQNNLAPERFRTLLMREGVSYKSLEDQIRAQIAWTRIIQTQLRPQIVIADNEVDAVMDRMAANQGREEYRVAEIFLPVESSEQEPDVKRLAERLTRQASGDKTSFGKLARQFSQAAGAAKGGDLGWVQQGQLPEAVDGTLAQMGVDTVSKPVRSLSGYHIIYLQDKRTISDSTIPSREQIRQNLGMDRLERMQRSYIMDLKSRAFIEQRV